MSEYLVLGAGGVGPAIAWWLLQQPDTVQVTLADADHKRAQRAVEHIASRDDIENGRCSWMYLDTTNAQDHHMRPVFAMFDVVVSAIPARFSPRLAALAISTDTGFCDLGGDRRITTDMRDGLHQKALDAGVSIVPDCGLAPGDGDILAADLAMRGATDITIYVGGLPQKPLTEAGNYQRTFSLEGLMLLLEPALVLQDGNITEVEAFDGLELLNVPALQQFNTGFGGAVEAFTTDGAGTAAWFMRRLGVKNFREKTVRWPGFVKFIRSIPRDRLLATLERVLPVTDAEHPDLVWMRVVGRKGNLEMSWELLDTYDHATGFSAMARTTGFSAATVAIAVAQGKTKRGVLPPEEALNRQGLAPLATTLNLVYSERTI